MLTDLFSLKGKTALVTGVSRGLGKGIACALAEYGADIVGVGISNMNETSKCVEELGGQFTSVHANLMDPTSVRQLPAKVYQVAERIDILVNNAGIIRRSPVEDYSNEDWQDVLDVNLNAVFYLCREFGTKMALRGFGKIINVASMLSFQGGLRVPAYAASKHGVVGLTRSLSNEWAGRGVNVNAIAPGYMVTDNTDELRANTERSKAISARIPSGRWGTPDDLKGAAIFLASKASDYVHGHTVCVDGGWMSS
ncbi:2-dehydro-3-deoxy-D-gluconate 5-dehydrogenase KduD [Alicyclobacillus sp. SO9]|uniref:2-dehydro-3-deoxy-D-gluconate 5-dehydrogenase KduD n=1 Tax=Alicyclobacillus sp. SO9 TaxID=2665646 RepID=UPI0018E84AE4|nr:2-dehydro-3-deoxy-D-gluconate 5-dehydrogenase KduD [Alicyclobacillus sp. SO9]QQE80248.1 2-dehydro-3-deoxy-D-gluconate 5-dehydrogenase KduD [Alicyclobacillus sp. SO9]